MPSYEELIHISETVEKAKLAETIVEKKTFKDYFALVITTFGVGYMPIASGTWGSMVGVLIYIFFAWIEAFAPSLFPNYNQLQITASLHSLNAILFLGLCLLGIWASGHSTKLFKHKDPSQAVVDEVIGQLLTFLFIPFTFSWKMILAGFLLFRLFDIWKPYPIDSLQSLPTGIGVCADDILAGVYAGAVLSVIYSISLIL